MRSSSLARLRFVHAAGWVVHGNLHRRDPGDVRSRPGMIFLSDHDGDLAEYVAAFGIVLAWSMDRAFGSYQGYPGSRPTGRFVDFVERGQSEELVRYAAYPEATVADIDQAVVVAARISDLRRLGEDTDDAAFQAAYRQLLDALVLAPEPVVPSLARGLRDAIRNWSSDPALTVLAPLEAGRTRPAVAALTELAGRADALFESVGGVHFARVAIVPVVPAQPGPTASVRDHLLVNAWYDGDRDGLVRRLSAKLDATAVDALWGCCVGYPGPEDIGVLADWILRHHRRFSLFVDSRAGRSVEEIRRLLDLRARALAFVTAVQGESVAEVRRQIPSLWT